ncbi:MAG: hypothetical protein A4E48_00285 [Methanosaeta sp. PtaU1.Bin060]|nr:MAG: hypothetical protein A4E48_00285 [Methanosaeta sp. PtaU1.Bin060]
MAHGGPFLNITIVSQGIPVGSVEEICNEFNTDTKLWRITRGCQCKARISVAIDGPDQQQVEHLTWALSNHLWQSELGINPIDDDMQFRGFDPPQFLGPYDEIHPIIYRGVLDFFVEYTFSWTNEYPSIREFDITADWGSIEPIYLHAVGDGALYKIDMLLER